MPCAGARAAGLSGERVRAQPGLPLASGEAGIWDAPSTWGTGVRLLPQVGRAGQAHDNTHFNRIKQKKTRRPSWHSRTAHFKSSEPIHDENFQFGNEENFLNLKKAPGLMDAYSSRST